MEIVHQKEGSKGSFYYVINGVKLAESTYSMAGPQKMIIDHTEVDESLKGQGVGLEIIKAAVAYARENEIKILPLCPFANAMFKKYASFREVQF
jgi:hypothetical protein